MILAYGWVCPVFFAAFFVGICVLAVVDAIRFRHRPPNTRSMN